eukprot:CAMPEP_0176130838 /NCGR_PEP_ID=MMETSP0120_2-20121206/66212_1 /TAXON_ID=160619 /ORGANISM="Kryptoperidinium foliaceum, Strain CCMP 1326" /LENGTH=47 /DNA_ID= /DNA_START= /DNA_END= /DNA_ORIENTATION=
MMLKIRGMASDFDMSGQASDFDEMADGRMNVDTRWPPTGSTASTAVR